MQQQYTRGKIKLKSEDGTVLVIAVFLIMLFAILFAGIVQLGIYLLARDQLQTAADAAALAGASSGTHRYVKINVITDRGQRTVCNKDECWCSGCNTISINNIPGDEKTLIDEGGWKDFCVPECDCGGGDCWFELVDRNMMYDTHSMGWGVSKTTIDNTEKEITEAARTTIAEYGYGYTSTLNQIFKNLTLEQISTLLGSKNKFMQAWMNVEGYTYNCGSECAGDTGACYPCEEWMSKGDQAYKKVSDRKKFVDKCIQTMSNMRTANSRSINKLDEEYTQAAGRFFEANLPKNASDAGIQKITVYGYDQKNSPYYPSVVVYATAKIKTMFPSLFPNDLQTTVCASGATSFRDADDQKTWGNKFYNALTGGKWYRVPEDACWVDW